MIKFKPISRRKFLLTALLATPLAMGAEAVTFEPTWLKVQRLRIGSGEPACRLAHFSDVHHKGDRDYLQTVVNTINALQPDFACFTGDLVEKVDVKLFRGQDPSYQLMYGFVQLIKGWQQHRSFCDFSENRLHFQAAAHFFFGLN